MKDIILLFLIHHKVVTTNELRDDNEYEEILEDKRGGNFGNFIINWQFYYKEFAWKNIIWYVWVIWELLNVAILFTN